MWFAVSTSCCPSCLLPTLLCEHPLGAQLLGANCCRSKRSHPPDGQKSRWTEKETFAVLLLHTAVGQGRALNYQYQVGCTETGSFICGTPAGKRSPVRPRQRQLPSPRRACGGPAVIHSQHAPSLREIENVCSTDRRTYLDCSGSHALIMDGPHRRLSVVSGHFNVGRSKDAGISHLRPDVSGLQALLDHDNHDLRARMKDFMNQPVYIP